MDSISSIRKSMNANTRAQVGVDLIFAIDFVDDKRNYVAGIALVVPFD